MYLNESWKKGGTILKVEGLGLIYSTLRAIKPGDRYKMDTVRTRLNLRMDENDVVIKARMG